MILHSIKYIVTFTIFSLIYKECKGSYNIAENAKALSSSVSSDYPDWNASKAVDRNTNQNIFCGSCLLTENMWYRRIEYLQVDLGGIFSINKVMIYFPRNNMSATDDKVNDSFQDIYSVQDKSRRYALMISNDTTVDGPYCYKDSTVISSEFDLIQSQICEGTGRYVSIVQNHLSPGCPVGKYRSECTKKCSSFCINRICDPDSGACKYGCRESWFGQNCSHTKNIAYRQHATSSSHLSFHPEWNADKAVDGNENNNIYCGSCLYTGNAPGSPVYLKIDLAVASTFNRVEIFFAKYDQNNCSVNGNTSTAVPGRSKGYVIEYGDGNWSENCYEQSGHDFNFIENHSCFGTGSFVIITQRNPVRGILGPILEICEVRVFGCKRGYYGEKCDIQCPTKCKKGVYDPDSGYCLYGCLPGFIGGRCSRECPTSRFGDFCERKCGSCRDNVVCDKERGYCPDGLCERRYQGKQCDQTCGNGTYGYNCASECPECVDSACDIRTDTTTLEPTNLQQAKDNDISPMFIGMLLASLIIIVMIIAVTIICLRKYSQDRCEYTSTLNGAQVVINGTCGREAPDVWRGLEETDKHNSTFDATSVKTCIVQE